MCAIYMTGLKEALVLLEGLENELIFMYFMLKLHVYGMLTA